MNELWVSPTFLIEVLLQIRPGRTTLKLLNATTEAEWLALCGLALVK